MIDDADTEEEYMATETKNNNKTKSDLEPSLFCSHLSGFSYEILVHKRVTLSGPYSKYESHAEKARLGVLV